MTTVTGETHFQSCDDSQYSVGHDWFDDSDGVPNVVKIRITEPTEHMDGGLLSDTRVNPEELDQLDIISILTEDDFGPDDANTPEDASKQEGGVKRVVEALRSFQMRRFGGDTETSQESSGTNVPETPRAAKVQQRFFASMQNNSIPTTPTEKQEKSATRTPETLKSTPAKSVQKDGDEKGFTSLRRFALKFRKGETTPPSEPGLASMGEEDTVQ